MKAKPRQGDKLLRTMVLSLLGNKCERCGETSNLHVHHKDENFTNNLKENLELLCKPCHNEEHSTRLKSFYKVQDNKKYKHKKLCQYCGQEFTSLSESQLMYNFMLHTQSCKNKRKRKHENELNKRV